MTCLTTIFLEHFFLFFINKKSKKKTYLTIREPFSIFYF